MSNVSPLFLVLQSCALLVGNLEVYGPYGNLEWTMNNPNEFVSQLCPPLPWYNQCSLLTPIECVLIYNEHSF